jgi:hypothetical protein
MHVSTVHVRHAPNNGCSASIGDVHSLLLQALCVAVAAHAAVHCSLESDRCRVLKMGKWQKGVGIYG